MEAERWKKSRRHMKNEAWLLNVGLTTTKQLLLVQHPRLRAISCGRHELGQHSDSANELCCKPYSIFFHLEEIT
ncbi:uncharacterized protein DS421_20g705270 [Arachis hypogaea]|nr:uncharacterized protein DS421_20g705270 [Arachis hypogaea]